MRRGGGSGWNAILASKTTRVERNKIPEEQAPPVIEYEAIFSFLRGTLNIFTLCWPLMHNPLYIWRTIRAFHYACIIYVSMAALFFAAARLLFTLRRRRCSLLFLLFSCF